MMEIKNVNVSELFYLLTAVFVILKFAGEIEWSWWIVFSPLIVLLIVTIVAVWALTKK